MVNRAGVGACSDCCPGIRATTSQHGSRWGSSDSPRGSLGCHVSLPSNDDVEPVPLNPLALAYMRALRLAVATQDVGLLLEAGQAHGRDCRPALSWSERVFLTYVAACTGVGCAEPGIRLPPWADRSAGVKRVVWSQEGVVEPRDEDAIVLSPAR